MAHANQERWATLVDAKLRNQLVTRDNLIFNSRYEGDPTSGKVKIPVRDTEVAVKEYDKANGIAAEAGTTTYLDLNIDHDEAVNELIDGYDADSVPDDIVADRLDSAGYSLALQMEKDASEELTTGGTVLADTAALTKATVYEKIVDARTQLSNAYVPTNDRWLLVSPDTYALLLKSPEFIKASDLGDAVVQTGAVGRVAGFNVFEDTTLGDKVDFVAGHPNWFTRVEEWTEPVAVNDLKGSGTYIGACAVQGRKVYAHKVTKAAAILVKKHV